MSINSADIWGLIIMLGGCGFLWWFAGRVAVRGSRSLLQWVVVGTFSLRAAWSIFQHIIYPPAWVLVAADARARYAHALQYAALWHEGMWKPRLPISLAESHEQLIRLQNTALVYIFGPSAVPSEAITITLNVTIVIAVYLICRHIGADRKATHTSVFLSAFLPSLLLWSTQIVKDPITGTLIAWSALATLKVTDGIRKRYLILLIATDFLTVAMRPYVGILLIVGQGLAWVSTVKLPPTTTGKLLRGAMFAALIPLFLHFGVKEMQSTYGEGVGLQWAVDQFNIFRQSGVALGDVKGSEYIIPLHASTPTQAILQLPIRVLLLLLSPIPIVFGSLIRMMTYPEMWFIYFWVAPRFGTGIREAWRKNRRALFSILLILTPLITSYALKTAVSGEAIRMRSQFLPLLLIFAGVGHAVYARRRRERKEAIVRRRNFVRYINQQEEPQDSMRA